MHNEVQWASYNEEEQELFCVPQTGQLGLMCVSNRKKTLLFQSRRIFFS